MDGLYHQKFDYPPETIISHSFYEHRTEYFFRFYREKMLPLGYEPNITHKVLARWEQEGKLRGIVNGIDVVQWDPKTDTRIAAPYDITEVLDKKKENKRALQEELGLEVDDGKFVLGLISRLTNQKGLDLVNEILPGLIDGNTQIAVLGTGDAVYEGSFRNFENWYKGSVCSCIMYDEGRAHRIYAGADAFLMPSKSEPCGLAQMVAARYGTLPIVRETGGLKDSIHDMGGENGNGFTFQTYNAHDMLAAIQRAEKLFADQAGWKHAMLSAMNCDFSWDKSAKEYVEAYELIMED